MAKRPKTLPPVYIGQWIRALGMRPAEVAREADINEGYLSELISGSKPNPSLTKLQQIAGALRIPVDNLFRPPPDKALLEQLNRIDPAILSRLKTTEH